MSASSRRVTFASNNAEVGGGEVMLLAMARAGLSADWQVHMVGPHADGGVLDLAAAEGLSVTRLSSDRPAYMRELRRWDRNRRGLLWCNGLVPATATSGHRDRVVHLHRLPEGLQKGAAWAARLGATRTVVPSTFMIRQVRDALVLPNWSPSVVPQLPRERWAGWRVGFIGRLGLDKGVHVLAEAATQLIERGANLELVIAGEARFVDPDAARQVGQTMARLGDRVIRLGWTTPASLFGQIDLLVIPSVWDEPFGLVATEAMSAGVPVVISDAGALPEVLGPGHPWVSRRGDADDLATVIGRALSAPDSERTEITSRARERWRTHYSPQAGTARFAHMLESLHPRSG